MRTLSALSLLLCCLAQSCSKEDGFDFSKVPGTYIRDGIENCLITIKQQGSFFYLNSFCDSISDLEFVVVPGKKTHNDFLNVDFWSARIELTATQKLATNQKFIQINDELNFFNITYTPPYPRYFCLNMYIPIPFERKKICGHKP